MNSFAAPRGRNIYKRMIFKQMITVIDFEGLSLFGGDTRFHRAMGQASEMSALYYPQVPWHTRAPPKLTLRTQDTRFDALRDLHKHW